MHAPELSVLIGRGADRAVDAVRRAVAHQAEGIALELLVVGRDGLTSYGAALDRAMGRVQLLLAAGAEPAGGVIDEHLRAHAQRNVALAFAGREPCAGASLRTFSSSVSLRGEPGGHDLVAIAGAEVGPSRGAVGWAEHGARDLALARRHPQLWERLEVGAFNSAPLRENALRRALLALRARPPAAGGGAAVGRLDYWRGVRREAGSRREWQRLTRGVPILMYHAVGAPGEPASTYVVPCAAFAAQLRWLRRRGHRVISLEEYRHERESHRLPEPGTVVITFDDGYADNRTEALPQLERHGFPAAVFMVSGAVGGANRWVHEGPLAGRPMLGWPELAALQERGVTIGAHTRSHTSLAELPREEVLAEVSGSRADLEAGVGAPVTSFSYPNGRQDAEARAAVREAGIQVACGSEAGLNDPGTPLLSLRRVEVRGHLGLKGFALALRTGKPGLRHVLRSGR